MKFSFQPSAFFNDGNMNKNNVTQLIQVSNSPLSLIDDKSIFQIINNRNFTIVYQKLDPVG
ncbi:hypothetical protein [Okeania sp. SIO3B5]|uniref:hypothetical protein n=1 Tax=Okeania sp. SIO3B5 TaxID=2607811 RepID=UPI0025E78138|nr:hypothetical protein [Okeania sp. SIO3B5]